MRLGLVTSSYPRHPGESVNAGVFVRSFALELAARGHRVSVLAPRREGFRETDPGIRLVTYGLPEPGPSLSHLDPTRTFELVRLCSVLALGASASIRFGTTGRFHHLLAFWAIPSGVLARIAARASHCPYSVWALGSDIWDADSYPLGVRAMRWALDRACRVFADGHCLARHTKRLSGRSAEFLASSRRLPSAATLPTWTGERRHVLFVGRYHENKGPDLFLDAVAELPDGLLDGIRVHMFGHGPLEGRLLDQLSSSPRLRKTVSVNGTLSAEGLAAALRASDVLVVPSRIESVPVVLSDAAQCGTPVACTDVGDMGALVRGHRAGAVAFEASPSALAAAIRETLETPRSAYAPGLAGLWRDLDLERSVERFLELATGEG